VLGGADGLALPADQRVVLFTDVLEIGRHAPTEAVASARRWVVADRMTSGRHAVIRQVGRDFELTDLDSTNGTVVDGMIAQPKLKLRDGSMIFVGGVAAVFRLVSTADVEHIRAELSNPMAPVPTCNPELARICSRMRRLAETEGELLLTGETGVGKEVYAHAVHRASGREGRFVAINCAALPRELVESELFGYARGAHSQASAAKPGIIEDAEGGTLFLDEIGEMAPDLQTKLLRFTQDRLLMAVGGTRPRRVDVRILAATSRTTIPGGPDAAGLRQDLAARLGAEPLRIPPLRERREDLGALIGHFTGPKAKPFELSAFHTICLYSWPGNVRELQKVTSTASALARGQDKVSVEHLPQVLAAGAAHFRLGPAGRVGRRASPTASELEDLLRQHDGNMLKVARALSRKPAVVYRWAKRFHLDPASHRKRTP
jgi:transcriptional regulator with PAS, ATPase and Fis domain